MGKGQERVVVANVVEIHYVPVQKRHNETILCN